MRLAASLINHKLQLECYHPSDKFSTPWWFCEYLGTDGFNYGDASEDDLFRDIANHGRLGRLAGLYSHFRPTETFDRRILGPHPAGDVPGHPDIAQNLSLPIRGPPEYGLVSQVVSLDEGVLFTQLMTNANLVRVDSPLGWLRGSVTVAEGVLRVWRHWLANQLSRGADGAVKPVEKDSILWMDQAKNVGLDFNVKETSWTRNQPIIMRQDEDVAVSYALEHEELLIRTTHLLFMFEESMQQDNNRSGKAVVFGSFRSTS